MHKSEFVRRRFLQMASAGAITAASGTSRASAQPPKPSRLIMNASGGAMGNASKEAYGKVFQERTGIPVEMTSPPNLGKLKAMVQTKNIEWDVTELNSSDARLAGAQGLLEKIDETVVDRSSYPADARDPYVLTAAVYSTNLAFRTDVFTKTQPSTWADFWDVSKFPGARTLWNSPIDNLEFALLADGVEPSKLYPLDVDRAFRKLDQIRKHVAVFWDSGAQQVQLFTDKEVVLGSAWNGRMMTAAKTGAPVRISWNGAVVKQFYVGIPKGAPNAYWSQRFLAAMTDPKAQSTFANMFASPGLNPESLKFSDPKVVPYLPTEPSHLKVAFWQNDVWWNENVVALKERWQRWMLG